MTAEPKYRASAGLEAATPPRRDLPPPPPRLSKWDGLFRGAAFTAVTVLADVALAATGVAATLGLSTHELSPREAPSLWAVPLLTVAFMWVRGLYQSRLRVIFLEEVGRLISAVWLASMTLLLWLLIVADDASGKAGLVIRLWVAATALVGIGRLLRAVLLKHLRGRRAISAPTLIVGFGSVGRRVARRLEERPEYGLCPVGFVDFEPPPEFAESGLPAALATPEDIGEVTRITGATHVIVAFSWVSDRQLLQVTRACRQHRLKLWVIPRLFDATNHRMDLDYLGGIPVLNLGVVNPRGWQFRVKYTLDRVVAVVCLLSLAPVLALIACAVRLSSRGPILFRQRRVGRDGQVFDLLKFRSMAVPPRGERAVFQPPAGAAPGGVEGRDDRTAIGRWLRRTSLDELPQLINVLRGDMSLIGPRPERPEYVFLFEQEVEHYRERHRVKSGITGWAQVHGLRGKTSITDRAEWDNYYIENWSLSLDLRILVLTVLALFRRVED